MLKYANMKNNVGTNKGIPFHQWKKEETIQKNKTFLKHFFDKIISDPSKDKKIKQLAKNIKRVGLK
jgi:hypothetical protein